MGNGYQEGVVSLHVSTYPAVSLLRFSSYHAVSFTDRERIHLNGKHLHFVCRNPIFPRAAGVYKYRRKTGIFMIGTNNRGSPVEEKGYKRMIKQPDYPESRGEKPFFQNWAIGRFFFS
jgi:hypothetical protein